MDEPSAVEVVVTGIDVPMNDLFAFALKATAAVLLALVCVGIVVGLPLLLVIQATR